MAPSDSDEAEVFGNEKDEELEGDNDVEGDDTDAEGELDAEGEVDSEGDEESGSDSDEDSEDGDDDNEEEASPDAENEDEDEDEEDSAPEEVAATQAKAKESPTAAPSRSLSPAYLRRSLLYPSNTTSPRSYTIEAVCALPHPVATHSLASSLCMTHLLTGSDDGYIRDYDVFTACNSKNFLSQPQRQHCGIQEGAIKAPVSRMWWENPLQPPGQPDDNPVGQSLSPVNSLLMQSDALWGLSGTSVGSVNLFTVRHDPGRIFHSLAGHHGPVSALAMLHGEKGFISAGWDGEALQWDLNTGQKVRNFSHGAQLTAIGMRPLSGPSGPNSEIQTVISVGLDTVAPPVSDPEYQDPPNTAADRVEAAGFDGSKAEGGLSATAQPPKPDGDTKSETSYDPLFDDEPDADDDAARAPPQKPEPGSSAVLPSTVPKSINATTPKLPPAQTGVVPPSRKPAIPLLDPVSYQEFSNDVLLAASIDGQVVLWDRRVQTHGGVGRLEMSEKCPPWCLSACWACDGTQIYAGRRNGTIDLWDVRVLGRSTKDTPRLLKTLRNPSSSGAVSCVVGFPDGTHLACASLDNIRLWNVADAREGDGGRRTTPAFKIIAGHHGGIVSQILVDVGARFMVTASGNRGWSGDSTRTVLVHDVRTVFLT